MCDRCGVKKWYVSRVDGFQGSFLDDSWRGQYYFVELKGAWQRGEINVTWWCNDCQTRGSACTRASVIAANWLHRFQLSAIRAMKKPDVHPAPKGSVGRHGQTYMEAEDVKATLVEILRGAGVLLDGCTDTPSGEAGQPLVSPSWDWLGLGPFLPPPGLTF